MVWDRYLDLMIGGVDISVGSSISARVALIARSISDDFALFALSELETTGC